MKKLIFKLLRYSGLPFLSREIFQRNKVSILLFHDISNNTALQTFKYLTHNYNILDLNDFIEASEKKDFSKIPKKALIITFDDAHIRNYEMLPAIKKFKIPITIFLCASIINTNRHFWFKLKNKSISTSELKYKSNKNKLDLLSKVGFQQEKEFNNAQALQKVQIEEMKRYINMQSHTLFHPILPKCDDDEAKEEIFKSKQILEKEYGLNINAISYPNGDYSDRDIQLSKDAGYKCGITVDFGFNTLHTDIFRLKRLSVNDTNNIDELIVKASGVWSFFKTRNGRYQKFGYTKNTEN
jgi:peptidoglycan/xylan/chitin deacetylase (PgdA/CDA1 family)